MSYVRLKKTDKYVEPTEPGGRRLVGVDEADDMRHSYAWGVRKEYERAGVFVVTDDVHDVEVTDPKTKAKMLVAACKKGETAAYLRDY